MGNSFKIGGLGQQLYSVLIFFYDGLYIFSTDFKGINTIYEIRISKTCKTGASKVSEKFRQSNHHITWKVIIKKWLWKKINMDMLDGFLMFKEQWISSSQNIVHEDFSFISLILFLFF